MSALPLQVRRRRGANAGISAILALVALAVAGAAGIADGEQIQTLPSQQDIPPPQVTQPPALQQPGESMPHPPITPGGQGNTREIPLPEVFHGCWSGDVARVDSIVPLGPDTGRIVWLTKSYTLCYKQTYKGRWQLTFAEGSVSDATEVWDQRQSIQVKSVSGPERAKLSAYLHFRAPRLSMFGQPTGGINTLDELTSLDCVVVPGGGEMEVRARVFVEMDDTPYAQIMWHTRLLRTVAGGG